MRPHTAGNFRRVFSAADGTAVLGELPFVGRTRLNRARVPGVAPHSHPGALEVFYIERGAVEWWSGDEAAGSRAVPAGHVYINRPGEPHGSAGPSLRPCAYVWFQWAPAGSRRGRAGDGSGALRDAALGLRRRTFAASAGLRDAFLRLWELHDSPPPAHAAAAVRAQLQLVLVHLVNDHAAAGPAAVPGGAGAARTAAYSRPVRAALELVAVDPARARGAADMARAAGLRPTQFSERFLAEVGFTPAHYLRRARVDHAKRLIDGSRRSLAEIALACGFSSGQHMATVFRRIEGTSPSAYARRRSPGPTRADPPVGGG